MRHDEHGWEPISPAMAMDVRVGLDAAAMWRPGTSNSGRRAIPSARKGNFRAWRLLGTAPGWDRLSSAPGLYSYVFPNTRQTANYVRPFLRTIYLRAPGRIQHNFASESFMDEVAEAAGVNPIEYRLRHLKDPEAIAIVKMVAEETKWEPRTAPRKKTAGPKLAVGRGFAFGEHSEGQQIAFIAEVTVSLETAELRVPRIVAVSQCGLIVNPDGLKHQVQGAILQGLSRTLHEELNVRYGSRLEPRLDVLSRSSSSPRCRLST